MSHSKFVVENVRGKSVVVEARSEAPLRLLNPANDGDGAWVFLSSLGGGFVGDDALALDLEVRESAKLFLSSQSSSKAYRDSRSSFTLDARVGSGATFIAWPEPVTCFAGAGLRQLQRVSLQPSASLLFVDAFTAGRVAREERWAFEDLESRLHVDVGDTPWLREGVRLSSTHGEVKARMFGLDAFATVVLVGPQFEDLARALTASLHQRSLKESVLVTCSPRDGGALLRLASPGVEALHLELQALLSSSVTTVLRDLPLPSRG